MALSLSLFSGASADMHAVSCQQWSETQAAGALQERNSSGGEGMHLMM